MPAPGLTEQQRESIINDYGNGLSVIEIAEKYGIGGRNVYYYIHKILRPKKYSTVKIPKDSDFFKDVPSLTTNELCEKYNLNRHQVRYACYKNGIKPKRGWRKYTKKEKVVKEIIKPPELTDPILLRLRDKMRNSKQGFGFSGLNGNLEPLITVKVKYQYQRI